MFRHLIRFACLAGLGAALLAAVPAGATTRTAGCQNDSKLLPGNPIFINSDTATPGYNPLALTSGGNPTWWGITKAGFEAASPAITGDTNQLDFLNASFGTSYGSLGDAVYGDLILGVKPLDQNGNDYVCAARIPGTHALFFKKYGFSDFNSYFFNATDDKKGPA